jgi:hypothetical protein
VGLSKYSKAKKVGQMSIAPKTLARIAIKALPKEK